MKIGYRVMGIGYWVMGMGQRGDGRVEGGTVRGWEGE
jgi:hypothetical protein